MTAMNTTPQILHLEKVNIRKSELDLCCCYYKCDFLILTLFWRDNLLLADSSVLSCGPTARNDTSPSPWGGAAGPVDAETKILSSEQRTPKRADRSIRCVPLNIAEFVEVVTPMNYLPVERSGLSGGRRLASFHQAEPGY